MAKTTAIKTEEAEFLRLIKQFNKELTGNTFVTVRDIHKPPPEFVKYILKTDDIDNGWYRDLSVSVIEYKLLTKFKKEFVAWLKLQS